MTKNKHPKLELAKKMMTHKEIKDNITPFNCAAWIEHSQIERDKEIAKNKHTK